LGTIRLTLWSASPLIGDAHARVAIAAGKRIVMVNVEADVLAGPFLAEGARVVVYSLACRDQPTLTCELVNRAHACRFEVVAATRGPSTCPLTTP
jgi:predicted homoserine dehydrogenase-like protein